MLIWIFTKNLFYVVCFIFASQKQYQINKRSVFCITICADLNRWILSALAAHPFVEFFFIWQRLMPLLSSFCLTDCFPDFFSLVEQKQIKHTFFCLTHVHTLCELRIWFVCKYQSWVGMKAWNIKDESCVSNALVSYLVYLILLRGFEMSEHLIYVLCAVMGW